MAAGAHGSINAPKLGAWRMLPEEAVLTQRRKARQRAGQRGATVVRAICRPKHLCLIAHNIAAGHRACTSRLHSRRGLTAPPSSASTMSTSPRRRRLFLGRRCRCRCCMSTSSPPPPTSPPSSARSSCIQPAGRPPARTLYRCLPRPRACSPTCCPPSPPLPPPCCRCPPPLRRCHCPPPPPPPADSQRRREGTRSAGFTSSTVAMRKMRGMGVPALTKSSPLCHRNWMADGSVGSMPADGAGRQSSPLSSR